MTTVISVENVSKLYRLGTISSGTLSHDLNRWWARLRGRPDPLLKIGQEDHGNREGEYIWALRDVSFEVQQGEVLGIIGRNGAGKSTLLKILSRVTAPTSGQIKVKGRIASLLEVGTGFHPELTGRENIFLNGAILGMAKAEIRRKFDEIVAFAEIEKFIDTPVKRYSSGMYVRLAFAVAAHLEPEILLVDEVLAVGDAAFQKKCLGKMGEVAKEGRTVLFVSHNMAAISGLCERTIVLEQGSILAIDKPIPAIQIHLGLHSPDSSKFSSTLPDRQSNGPIWFTSFYCEVDRNQRVDHLITGECARFVLEYQSRKDSRPRNVGVSIVIYTAESVRLTNLWNEYESGQSFSTVPSQGEFVCEIPKLPLRTGQYVVDLYCSVNGEVSDWIPQAGTFEVSDGDYYGSGRITHYHTGCVFLDHNWGVRRLDQSRLTVEAANADE